MTLDCSSAPQAREKKSTPGGLVHEAGFAGAAFYSLFEHKRPAAPAAVINAAQCWPVLRRTGICR